MLTLFHDFQSGDRPPSYREQRYKHQDKDRSRGSHQKDSRSHKGDNRDTVKDTSEAQDYKEKSDTKGRRANSSTSSVKEHKESKDTESVGSGSSSKSKSETTDAQTDKRLRNKVGT